MRGSRKKIRTLVHVHGSGAPPSCLCSLLRARWLHVQQQAKSQEVKVNKVSIRMEVSLRKAYQQPIRMEVFFRKQQHKAYQQSKVASQEFSLSSVRA